MRFQRDVGDPSEQTRQAKGVMHATGIMDPQHTVKTHLGRNVIISRSTCETDIPYLPFSHILGIWDHQKGIGFRAHLLRLGCALTSPGELVKLQRSLGPEILLF